ncbi:MAG: aminotransferase class I/II-fold pyridoxal phosphate-dependent enzyme [Gammaproteobacteria bacterium]|nr:aminotransferase class I/II-fold pyridoxal phosphate-dependent enzyme [Gammaproteobacteria bacterium]
MSETTSPTAAVCNPGAPPGGHDYPPAAIPLTPTIGWSGLGHAAGAYSSLLDIPHVCVSAGRAAIALALQHAGIGRGDEVLVPAYHCESMIAPVEHVEAQPVYYRIGRDTHVDLDDIAGKITPSTRAILATHYFGFDQVMQPLRELCDRHELILIEDCAHAFFCGRKENAIGRFGDYAIGSAMKFFPLFDGGLLASSRHRLDDIDLFQPSWSLEAKGTISILEYAMRYGRLKLVSLPLRAAVALKDTVWGATKKLLRNRIDGSFAPSSSEGGYALEPKWINARMSRVSRLILKRTDTDRIGDGRRHNYQHIVDALADVPGIAPLFPALPGDVVPLVVPMVVDNPSVMFPRLKHAGVPIWRFGEYLYPEIDESVCSNTLFLSRHVFQFPCHPELRPDEIDWMVDTIREQLRSQ